MSVETIYFGDLVLRLRCSEGGAVHGAPCGPLLAEAIDLWMRAHPEERLEQVDIDCTETDCVWEEGTLAAFVPLARKGIVRFRLLARPEARPALEALVAASGLPWFTVEERVAQKNR